MRKLRLKLAQSLRAIEGEMRCMVGLAPKPMLSPYSSAYLAQGD